MALAHCPECNNTISQSAFQCPHCGHPLAGPPPTEARANQAAAGSMSGLSLAAMICGITGLVLLIVPCIWWLGMVPDVLAVVLSCIALSKIRHGEASGRGMAIAGLVCGIVGIVITLPLLVYVQYVFADATSE